MVSLEAINNVFKETINFTRPKQKYPFLDLKSVYRKEKSFQDSELGLQENYF